MDLNGNGITVSNDIWARMKKYVPLADDGKPIHPIKADYLKPVVEEFRNKDTRTPNLRPFLPTSDWIDTWFSPSRSQEVSK
jgi:hypothetical protein